MAKQMASLRTKAKGMGFMALDLAIFIFAVVGHNGNNGDNGMHGLVLSANPLDEWFCFQWQSLFLLFNILRVSVLMVFVCWCVKLRTFRTIRTKQTTIFERKGETIYYIYI